MCCFELTQEAGVVLGEHTKVGHTVFQVSDALHTHTEGIARVLSAVDAAGLEHIRVYHSAAQNLHPAGMLAEAAALAATDVAGDVHLG